MKKGYTLISKVCGGYTLVEIMVVIVVFVSIALIAAQTIIVTLHSTYKASAISTVRQNLDYAIGSMTRQIRGAKSITSACTGVASTQITFVDQNANSLVFACGNVNSINSPSTIASGSANLINNTINISSCSFTCSKTNASAPPVVTISITGNDINGQNAPVIETTEVTLRSY